MPGFLSDTERQMMLQAARQAIADTLAGRGPAPLAAEGVLASAAGVFVSLHKRKQLRGCIGYPSGDQPLASVLCRSAIAAATEDPRFPPVTADELAGIDIEISVLTPVVPVETPSEIEVGRHGLVIELHGRRGLLLPQVATEHGWDRDTFLAQTCVKAGLARDAWKSGARIFRFEAEVFGER